MEDEEGKAAFVIHKYLEYLYLDCLGIINEAGSLVNRDKFPNRHQAAGAAVLEVGCLQILGVVVGVDAQFVRRRLRQGAPVDGVGVLEGRFQRSGDDGGDGEKPELAGGVGKIELGDEGDFLLDDDVDGGADID